MKKKIVLINMVFFYVFNVTIVLSDPISRPFRRQEDIGKITQQLDQEKNDERAGFSEKKYHSHNLIESAEIAFKKESSKMRASEIGLGNKQCPLDFEVLWVREVGSSVYATPLIHTLHSEDMNSKQIVVATFLSFLEMLEWDGEMPYGWPLAFEGRAFHSSPTIFDVDNDGHEDLCVVDTDGSILWIQVGTFGRYLRDLEVVVPSLNVHRDWHDLIDDKIQEESIQLSMFNRNKLKQDKIDTLKEKQGSKQAKETETLGDRADFIKRKKLSTEKRNIAIGRKLMFTETPDPPEEDMPVDDDQLLFDDDYYFGSAEDYYYDRRGMYYGLESPAIKRMNESDYLLVDAHVLASPVIADLNGDGFAEIYLAVSYFFADGRNVGPSVDPKKFVGGGVLCYDLLFQEWSWTVHLDLTTDETLHRAYIYSSPTVADIDGDGHFEVIIGTALGLVYVLDAGTGDCRKHFPIQMGSIEAGIAVADVHGDANLELIVVDTQGNLVVIDAFGSIVWDKRVSGAGRNNPVVGDINGDGKLDIVFVTTVDLESHVWAVETETGDDLPYFPMRLKGTGSSTAPVLLVDLHLLSAGDRATLGKGQNTGDNLRGETVSSGVLGGSGKGLHLVVPSFDGHIYIIEGSTGCTNAVDIGEHVAAMVLAEDTAGDGLLDLLVSTTGGEVINLATNLPAHPLNTWASHYRNRINGFVHGSHQGIYVLEHLTRFKNVLSYFVTVTFEIVDHRNNLRPKEAKYKVQISKGTNTLHALFEKTYSSPGVYTENIILKKPQYTTLYVGMWNDKGQYFEHVIAVAYNTNFHQTLKWMVIIPFFLSMTPLLLLQRPQTSPLPV